MQPTMIMSCSFQKGFSRSLVPAAVVHPLPKSSMGGWAKYFSRIGMLKSSMRMAQSYPLEAPNRVLRLSIFDSRKSCV